MYHPDQYVPEWKPENLTQLHICWVSPHYSEHKQELLEKSVVSQKGNHRTTKGRTSIPKSPCVGHLKVNCAIVVHVIHPKCNKVILLIFSICKKNKEKVPEYVFSEMRPIGARVALLHQVPEYFNNNFHFILVTIILISNKQHKNMNDNSNWSLLHLVYCNFYRVKHWNSCH